jgi:hypothetical protein
MKSVVRVQQIPNLDRSMIEYCKQQRREAAHACLQRIQNHVIAYLNDNLNNQWMYHQHLLLLRQYDNDYEIIFHHDVSLTKNDASNTCSYENWIRQCHPENARFRKSEDSENTMQRMYQIDKRFYFEDSDHRKLWNTCVTTYGRPELIVNARMVDYI